MQSFAIKNQVVLDILEKFRCTYLEKYDIVNMKTNGVFGKEIKDQADYYTGSEFMKSIINMGRKHEGAADKSYSHAIKPEHYYGDRQKEYKKDWIALDEAIKTELGLGSSALSQVYPPNGFIGWHNNANASAFNLIFTWSETGDGWFKYIDPKTGKLVTMDDSPGWTLKAGYFGEYGSGKVVYHAARTYCTRMTLSYVLGHDKDYWQDCIDHINNY
jgi:hypothetical protein